MAIVKLATCDIEWVIKMAREGIAIDETILLAQLCESFLTIDEVSEIRKAIRDFLETAEETGRVSMAVVMDLDSGEPAYTTGSPLEVALHKIAVALIVDRGVHLKRCLECKAIFFRHRHQTHCSRRCINRWTSRNYYHRKTTRNCKWCGISFRLSPKMAAKNKQFCSASCRMHDYRKRKASKSEACA